jgi:hypothetical protein
MEIVTWKEVRDQVAAVNKQLANVIDECNPTDNFKLIKASYIYGDIIVNQGVVNFPVELDGLQPLNNVNLPKTIKSLLSYQTIPLFLTLKNDNEVFVNTGNRIVPLNLFHQGSLLGVFETINFTYGKKTSPTWCVSAGARSIVMLPRITDNLGLDRLRLRYDIPATIQLQSLQDHWDFFTAIAHHENFEQPWENEVLFFTKDWLTQSDTKWSKFKDYIYKQGWDQAQFSIGKIECSLQWEMFAEAISMRNLKPRPYLADQVKHILSIASGKSPAFRPAVHNQHIAPIEGLQKAIIDVYQLKDYVPTILCICSLDEIKNHTPVYYSLSFTTLLEGSPIDKSTSTIMLDSRKIKLLLDTLKKYAKNNAVFDSNIIHKVEIDFFHSNDDKRGEIRSSSEIFLDDNSFNEDQERFQDRHLCDKSPFWRGCLRIKIINHDDE